MEREDDTYMHATAAPLLAAPTCASSAAECDTFELHALRQHPLAAESDPAGAMLLQLAPSESGGGSSEVWGDNGASDNDDSMTAKLLPPGSPSESCPTSPVDKSQSGRMGWSKRAGGLFAVLLMIVSWIATGELVQGLTPEYPHPFAICFCTRLGWSCLLLGWAVWR